MKKIGELAVDTDTLIAIIKTLRHNFLGGVEDTTHFCTMHKIFVLINNYKINKYLIISKFLYVTETPSDHL